MPDRFGSRVAGVARTLAAEKARTAALVVGSAIAVAVFASPVESLGTDGLLTAHVLQHIALADLVAPLLLLGLPRPARAWLGDALEGLRRRSGKTARIAAWVVSPIGAVVVWGVGTYLWFVPALHRSATPFGAVHGADHLAFLVLGLLIWLAPFDPRPTRPLPDALHEGGLPWWARHVYAMGTRIVMLPPAIAIWVAASDAYHRPGGLPFDLTVQGDQERAASVMIGFEMLLSALAVVLAFVFVSVHEGRERARGAT